MMQKGVSSEREIWTLERARAHSIPRRFPGSKGNSMFSFSTQFEVFRILAYFVANV